MIDKTKDAGWLQSAGSTDPGDPTGLEISDYIVDMLQELRDLAKSSGQGALCVLLELAEREARHDSVAIATPQQRISDTKA